MAGPVKLKGTFDTYLHDAFLKLTQFRGRLDIERTHPKVWSKQQLDDLNVLFVGIGQTLNALSELAGQVRED